jgi:hypothetical protein
MDDVQMEDIILASLSSPERSVSGDSNATTFATGNWCESPTSFKLSSPLASTSAGDYVSYFPTTPNSNPFLSNRHFSEPEPIVPRIVPFNDDSLEVELKESHRKYPLPLTWS